MLTNGIKLNSYLKIFDKCIEKINYKIFNFRRAELKDKELYFIDAIVNNEPKRNKLIEQWLHEGGEATKGMYPPSNVQCLLRIYLNAALSEDVKNFITIYFLIDVCSSQELVLIPLKIL